MKLAVLLGGPRHGDLLWVEEFCDPMFLDNRSGKFYADPTHDCEPYNQSLSDRDVAIYFWRIENTKLSAIRDEARQARRRHGRSN